MGVPCAGAACPICHGEPRGGTVGPVTVRLERPWRHELELAILGYGDQRVRCRLTREEARRLAHLLLVAVASPAAGGRA